MSYASVTYGRRAQRKSRRRSVLLDNIQNMDTIVEENINEVNWNSFVDPRTEQRFDRKVKQRYMSNWEHEQDIFDDELLKSMFHWNPDHYSKLPNKNRKNRNRNNSSGNSRGNIKSSLNYYEIQNNLHVQSFNQLEYQVDYHVDYRTEYQAQYDYHGKISYQDQKIDQPDSIKQFGPPPGLSKQPQNSRIIETSSNNYSPSNSSDTASDSEVRIILSDEELLKDRSAIFATDFSSDSNFSDNYNSDSDFGNDNTNSYNYEEQISGFQLNPTAQVFQPRFS